MSDNDDYIETHEVTEIIHELVDDCEEGITEYTNEHLVDEEVSETLSECSDDAFEPTDVWHQLPSLGHTS